MSIKIFYNLSLITVCESVNQFYFYFNNWYTCMLQYIRCWYKLEDIYTTEGWEHRTGRETWLFYIKGNYCILKERELYVYGKWMFVVLATYINLLAKYFRHVFLSLLNFFIKFSWIVQVWTCFRCFLINDFFTLDTHLTWHMLQAVTSRSLCIFESSFLLCECKWW